MDVKMVTYEYQIRKQFEIPTGKKKGEKAVKIVKKYNHVNDLRSAQRDMILMKRQDPENRYFLVRVQTEYYDSGDFQEVEFPE